MYGCIKRLFNLCKVCALVLAQTRKLTSRELLFLEKTAVYHLLPHLPLPSLPFQSILLKEFDRNQFCVSSKWSVYFFQRKLLPPPIKKTEWGEEGSWSTVWHTGRPPCKVFFQRTCLWLCKLFILPSLQSAYCKRRTEITAFFIGLLWDWKLWFTQYCSGNHMHTIDRNKNFTVVECWLKVIRDLFVLVYCKKPYKLSQGKR